MWRCSCVSRICWTKDRTSLRSSSDASLVQRSASFADRSSTARWVAASRPSGSREMSLGPVFDPSHVEHWAGSARRQAGANPRSLSPEIVRAILAGQQPVELTPTRLVMLSRNLPHDWPGKASSAASGKARRERSACHRQALRRLPPVACSRCRPARALPSTKPSQFGRGRRAGFPRLPWRRWKRNARRERFSV
jgi:hypothetical protein